MGERMRLECPLCSRRVCTIYHLDGRLACRRCNGLWYAAQRTSRYGRKAIAKRRIRRKLGDYGQLRAAKFPPKPRGMWRRTYARHCAALAAALQVICGLKVPWIEKGAEPWTTTRRAGRSFANGWRFRRRSGKQQNRRRPLLTTPSSRMNFSAAGVSRTRGWWVGSCHASAGSSFPAIGLVARGR
jgi:hypothetical protein